METKQVFVIGSGVMGRGIAQAAATSGCNVTLCDTSAEALKKSLADIEWSLNKFKQKGKISEEVPEIMGRIQTVGDFSAAKDADLVIEAAFENYDVKREIFKQLGAICPANTVLASNTSAIPITSLAAVTTNPERVVGLHFFNPVALMNMVEIVKGIATSDETVAVCKDFIASLNKKYCEVKRDVAGFVMNRIALCSTMEAIRLMEEGVATVEEIDTGMRMAYGWAMGPIETIDMTGLDVAMNATMAIYEESKDTKFLPPVTLCRLVASGNLGRKTGKGFYDYTK